MRRRAVLLLLLACVALGVPAAGAAPPTLTPGVLVVGVDMPSPGFQVGAVKGSQVLVARGFEISLARVLAVRLGVPAVRFYQEGQFPRLFSAGAKPWDMAIAQITITPKRQTTAVFSTPYLSADQGVLLSKLTATAPKTVVALRALPLCALAGSTGADLIASQILPTRKPLLAGNVTLLMQAVQTGRCGAAIYDAPSLATLKTQAPGRYGALVGVIATGEQYGVALPQGSELTPAVNDAIAGLIADGTIARLQKQWLSTTVASLPVLR